MRKRLLLTLAFSGMICISASAQSFYIDLNYQSFRPFIHFQLQIGNRHTRYNAYQSSYVKGYLDGVNSTYYSNYRFHDLVRQIDAYEAGYRDGQRDQQLYCRLHGYRQLPRRRFSYEDYYSSQIAIQLWLSDLTFTFLRAPERRLPHYWARRARPAVRRYRSRFRNHKYFIRVEKRYRNNRKRLIKRAHKARRNNRKRAGKHTITHQKRRSQKLNKRKAIQRLRQNANRHKSQKRTRARRVGRSRNKSKHPIKRVSHHRTSRRSPTSSSHKVQRKKVQRRRSSSRSHRVKRPQQKRASGKTKKNESTSKPQKSQGTSSLTHNK